MKPVPPSTLEQIAANLPAADLKMVDAIVEHESRGALVRLGEKIRSARILTDVARIYALAHAVWAGAGESQKEALVGFSGELLAIAVDRALALRALACDAQPPAAKGVSPVAEPALGAGSAFDRGLARRDHARHVLRAVAGRNAALLTRIEKAAEPVADAPSLAGAIQRLARIGRQFLRSPQEKMKTRVKLARLDESCLARLDDLAREIRRASKTAPDEPQAPHAPQEDIDFLDGVNLVLLSLIVNAFDRAHEIDPSIPRLVPVATRRLIVRRGAVNVANEPPAAQDPDEDQDEDDDTDLAERGEEDGPS
jgi:hypothetical protein